MLFRSRAALAVGALFGRAGVGGRDAERKGAQGDESAHEAFPIERIDAEG